MTQQRLAMAAASLVIAAAAVFVVGDAGLAQKKEASDPHAHHKAVECAKACQDCQRACDTCAEHCATLVSQGKTEHLKTMRMCNDCAAFCEMGGRVSARQGPMLPLAMSSCAEACKQCAKKCEEFPDDASMKACAEECRRCEKACNQMAAANKGPEVIPTPVR